MTMNLVKEVEVLLKLVAECDVTVNDTLLGAALKAVCVSNIWANLCLDLAT